MKIISQNRELIVDTTNADIFLDTDGTWHYVKMIKGKREYMLAGYPDREMAYAELSTIFNYERAKKDTYRMSV